MTEKESVCRALDDTPHHSVTSSVRVVALNEVRGRRVGTRSTHPAGQAEIFSTLIKFPVRYALLPLRGSRDDLLRRTGAGREGLLARVPSLLTVLLVSPYPHLPADVCSRRGGCANSIRLGAHHRAYLVFATRISSQGLLRWLIAEQLCVRGSNTYTVT